MPKLSTLRDQIAAKIATALGRVPAVEAEADKAAAEVELDRMYPVNREARRRAALRHTPRMRATPHTAIPRTVPPTSVKLALHRSAKAEKLRGAYADAREAGEPWIAPDVEQAVRDRRAAGRRARVARRLNRRR